MNNFEFEHNGKKYWYSRSIAAASFIFAKNANGDLCVLANKRGAGAPNEIGKWNCPCGYLDFNETVAQCAVREIYEETGLSINTDNIHLVSINDDPNENPQNVTFRYVGILDSIVEDLSSAFNTSNSEDKEVDDIKFIPVSEIDNYEWAFNHLNLIKSFSRQV